MNTTGAALEQVIGLLDGIDHGSRGGIGHEQRLGLVMLARSVANRVEALVGVLVAEADAAGSSLAVRGTPTTTWLGMSSPVSAKEAAGLVFTGRDLAAHPEMMTAALSGEIGVKQARSISGVLGQLPSDLDDAQRAAAERLLVDRARTTPAEKLATLAPAVLEAVCPAHPESEAEQRMIRLDEQRNRARLRRSLSFRSDGDGSTLISGSLPALDAAPLVKLIEAYVESDRRRARDEADRLAENRSPEMRRADALLALVAEHQRERRAPAVAGDRPRVVVTIREQDLRQRAEAAGLLDSGEQITAGELRRLCCDADLLPAVLGGSSEVLDMGRTQRLVTPAMRRALAIRDGGCVFPRCDKNDAGCDAHHINPWFAGGVTALSNLVSLCPHHHQLVEPPRFWDGPPPDRWEIRLDSDGLPEAIPPRRLDPQRKPIPCGRRARMPEPLEAARPQPPRGSEPLTTAAPQPPGPNRTTPPRQAEDARPLDTTVTRGSATFDHFRDEQPDGGLPMLPDTDGPLEPDDLSLGPGDGDRQPPVPELPFAS